MHFFWKGRASYELDGLDQFVVFHARGGGGGNLRKQKALPSKGGQKGELLERGGNLGDIVAGAKKGGTRNKGKDTVMHKLFIESTTG